VRVFQAIADTIAQLGVRAAFAFLSSDVLKLAAELDARGIKIYNARTEHTAVGMADGYSRASGNVGLAIIGIGPGLTGSVNALVTASRAHSSVLVLAGAAERIGDADTQYDKNIATQYNKNIDQNGILQAMGARHMYLNSPESAIADMKSCYETVRLDRTFLTLCMPRDVLEAEAGNEESQVGLRVDRPTAVTSQADIEAIANLFTESTWATQHPVIVAGRGAVRSGALRELLRLGDLTGALLGTSVMAKGLFGGSAYSVGVVGTFSTPVAGELLHSADLVLSFGASLNPRTTYSRTVFGKARIIQIDSDEAALSRFQPVDMTIVADASLAAKALSEELERRGFRGTGYRTNEVASRIRGWRETMIDGSTEDAMDPRSLMVALESLLPSNRAVIVDAGNCEEFPIAYLSVPDATSFLWPIEFGSLGTGLGNALGAAVARPDRFNVLSIGDGGLMQSLADLDTAVRYRIPLLVVVLNDSALGSELLQLRQAGYPDHVARYANPSFEAVARSLGLQAATVRSIADLHQIRERLTKLDGPMLLDCKIITHQRTLRH
jgi:thiamine pyrophosphate-dependent acetolactate synthase large subunit-like protein